LHEAGYDSYLTAWVYQQVLRNFDDVKYQCENMLNLNFSFFYINLKTMEDKLNPTVSLA
jgi:hypothetical protein